MLYNVTTMATIWHTMATRDVRLLKHQLQQIENVPSNCIFQNYLRCHDDIGWGLDYGFLGQFGSKEAPHKKYLNDWFTGKWQGSPSRGELYNDSDWLQDARLCGTTASLCGIEAALYENNEEALKVAIDADVMLHACMLTLRGIPVFYSGDELGMLNDYGYHDDPGRYADSRNIHRGKMDWDKAQERFDESTPTGRLFKELKKLIMIRKYNDVFHSDAHVYPFETGDNRVLGIAREYNGKHMFGLFNFSPEYVWAEADGKGYQLQPYGFRWIMNVYVD
jgi:amylosucrase